MITSHQPASRRVCPCVLIEGRRFHHRSIRFTSLSNAVPDAARSWERSLHSTPISAWSCLGTIPATSGRCYTARKALSAPADAVHRPAAVHRCSWGTDVGGHRGARDRPWAQDDTGSYGATGRITDVLAVHYGP